MTKVVDKYLQKSDDPIFMCDFSPPRGATPQQLEPARSLDLDFISVAYNPAKSVRVSAVAAASWIKTNTGRDVVFNIATRDMNKVALQSLLLGAQLLGLENLVVMRGDDFTDAELALAKAVQDFKPTQLMASIHDMNQGVDFRGRKLGFSTDFCVGGVINPAHDLDTELRLMRRKLQSGAQFFISQATFNCSMNKRLIDAYSDRYCDALSTPIFHGVQVMIPDGITFGKVPQWVTTDLSRGRSGKDIALQELHEFADQGFRSFYVVPPIFSGGRRDYEAVQDVVETFRGSQSLNQTSSNSKP